MRHSLVIFSRAISRFPVFFTRFRRRFADSHFEITSFFAEAIVVERPMSHFQPWPSSLSRRGRGLHEIPRRHCHISCFLRCFSSAPRQPLRYFSACFHVCFQRNAAKISPPFALCAMAGLPPQKDARDAAFHATPAARRPLMAARFQAFAFAYAMRHTADTTDAPMISSARLIIARRYFLSLS